MACLCAPTSHEGSFRCRLHRGLNPIANSAPNHPIRGPNHCPSSVNALPNQICCNPLITVRDSSASASASTAAQPPFDDRVRFSHTPQVAADHPYTMRSRLSSTPASPSASYTSSSTSPLSASSSHRSSSLPSSFYTSSSSSSSRASASSSSPSPSLPSSCTRPPSGKRTSSSSSSPLKSPYRVSSTSSSWCGANCTTPSASHAAALAIMKQHSHNKHGGARTYNRNILSPTSASKIGPSRLSRMAVACADELPLLKEEQCISNLPRHGNTEDTFSGSFADTREFAAFKVEPPIIGVKTRAAVNKFKQSESSCRIVGSNGGSLIMPTVY